MDPCTSGSVSSDSVPDTPASYENKNRNTETCQELFHEMVEDLVLQTCFKVHRAMRFGYFALDEYIVQDGDYILHDVPPTSTNDPKHHDLLALAASSKKPSHINCPHCKRKLGTNRFAPHLNSCMGEGGRQNKDRNAKRNCQTYESGDDDDDEDYSDSGKKKKKKGKNQRKTNKTSVKGKTVQINVFLSQKCGVVSRKSKSMCNNTLKCSIHSDEQRREIRRTLLKCEPDPNDHIDVDTVDVESRSPSPVDISLLSNQPMPRVKLEDVYATSEHPRPSTTTYI
ncbi:hypothetical protein JTE90_009683 [Oedothorax gibbosus]|uniref:SCA7 domain-containing protein n=1 Tax=Oedothorax gibbosus TaxID=931172 RepID=A0AAV6V846_9ARAC|nr:hypothetical protein JTE90_009683 [Oedothorax gibbosus]